MYVFNATHAVSFRVPLEVDPFVTYFSLIGDVLFFLSSLINKG